MLQSVFLFLLKNGLIASVLIVIVIGIRKLSYKRCNHVMCILWGLVAIRLICPFSFGEKTPVSVEIPISESFSGIKESNGMGENLSADERNSADTPAQDSIETSSKEKQFPTTSLWIIIIASLYHSGGTIWAIGFGMIVAYFMVSVLLLRRKVACGLRNNRIILCDEVSVPFVYGIFRPRICIPSSISEECRNDVLRHEETHILYGHHIWKLLYAVIAAVYWFHPVVWIAYSLFCRDLELACDDKVVSAMGKEEKKNYVCSLLICSGVHCEDIIVSFGNGQLKERTDNIMKEKNNQSKLKIIFFSVGFIALFGTFLLGIKWKAMKTEDNDSQNDMRDKQVNSVIPNSLENYFAYSGEKGFTIFVWEISKDNYRCGIMEGTNRFTMDNEDLLDMGFRQGISVEEMREVLAFYNLPDDMIVVEPFYPIQSSYASEHDYLSPEYRAFLRELIIGK